MSVVLVAVPGFEIDVLDEGFLRPRRGTPHLVLGRVRRTGGEVATHRGEFGEHDFR
jgi:hypothetical protein